VLCRASLKTLINRIDETEWTALTAPIPEAVERAEGVLITTEYETTD